VPRPRLLSRTAGDLALFKRSIAQHQEFFIRAGVFLLLQRLELLCFRGFFRRASVEGVRSCTSF